MQQALFPTKMHPSVLKSSTYIAASDVTSMNQVKQCKLLESKLGTDFTSEVLSQPDLSLRDMKECVVKADRMKTLEMSENHPSL